METGSLMSVKMNVRDIVIPSEERHIRMYPMDFEEFCDDEEFDIDVFNEMILEDYYVIRIAYENNFEDDFDEY